MDISGALRNAGLLYNRAELEGRERSDECSIPNSQLSSDGAPLPRMTIKNWELGNWSDAAMSRISEDASGFPEADLNEAAARRTLRVAYPTG